MQTFLPAPSFAESARLLDSRRLGKQRVEASQVLRAVVWPRYGWKRHPAVAMWRGFVPALVSYGLAVCDEWRARGHADALRPQLVDYTGGVEPRWADCLREGLLPPWLGDPALHTSHRSALLRKQPEHYRPLFGDLPDDLPYVWPRPAFPHWPARRAEPDRALAPEQAAALAGVDTFTDRQWAVLHELHAGRDITLSVSALAAELPAAAEAMAEDALSARPATPEVVEADLDLMVLVAGWSTPGLTARHINAPSLPADGADRPSGGVGAHPGTRGGKVSQSVARPPGPDDLAAMRVEARAESEFRFLRPGQPLPPPVDRFGLVVLDRVDRPRPPVAAPVLTVTP